MSPLARGRKVGKSVIIAEWGTRMRERDERSEFNSLNAETET